MNYIKRWAAMLLSLVMALSLLSGCGAQKTLSLTAVLTGIPATLDPAMVTSDAEKTVVSHLYENLMKLWPNTEGGVSAIPAAAKANHVVSESDGTETYTFTLRSDLTWSDGQSVTAADFVYAWQRLVDPKTASPNASLLDMVAGYAAARAGDVSKLQVSAPDDTTFQVVLSHPCPYFLSAVCTAAATMPVREDITLTNGAYRIAEQTDDALIAVAAEDYYDSKRIGPAELRFSFCETSDDAAARCQQGDWDVVLGLTEAQGDDAVVDTSPEVGVLLVNQMTVNVASEPLRQAMSLVIDRNAVATLLGNNTQAADGLIPTGIANTCGEDFRTAAEAAIDNVPEDYEKNCQTAREKLSTAKLEPAKLGAITLYHENTPEQMKLAQLLQSTWQEQLGLTVKVVELPQADLQRALQKGEFALALTTIRCDRSDPTGYLDIWRSGGSENYANFHSSAYDLLLRVSDASQSPEARDAYLEDAEHLLLDTGNVMPLYFTTRFHRMNNGLSGLFDDGLGTYYLSALRTGA